MDDSNGAAVALFGCGEPAAHRTEQEDATEEPVGPAGAEDEEHG